MYLPTAIALQLKDDSKVTVEIQLEDLIANSQTQNTTPNYLQLGKGLTISRVDPNPMYVKSEVEISGFGFSAETTANTVEFRNALNELVSAEIVSASDTILKVIVPDDAVTGLLNVTVNGETVQTNVTISETKLMLSFGDNGNLKDDSFQLTIDGTLIDQTTEGQAKLTKTITKEPGEYNMSIAGITVPDNRATFYVCFSSNVKVLSGETSRKVDIVDGEQFKQNLKIKVSGGAVSQPVNCQYANPELALQGLKIRD